MKKEIWKDVVGYEGLYEVSNFGRVKNLDQLRMPQNAFHKAKILKPHLDKDGYPRIGMTKNKKRRNYTVHRIVARAFIPNPDNLPQINHKDGVPDNNHVDNLEWCTALYNIRHSVEIGLNPNEQAIILKNLETGEEHYFQSQTKASLFLGKNESYVSHCLSRGENVKHGYRMKRVEKR